MTFDVREARALNAVVAALERVAPGAPADCLVDALKPCAPTSAALLAVIRPDAPEALASRAIRLPAPVLDAWLATPRALLARMIAPMVRAGEGASHRDTEALPGALRERLDVLRRLDAAGLGEGLGYKILAADGPTGPAHHMLALIPERGELLGGRARTMLAALNAPIREAVLRAGLPLIGREPILAQIVAEESLGYLCVSEGGALLELNRRAHELVLRYHEAARLGLRRTAATDFAAAARAHAAGGRPWRLASTHPPGVLEVHVHRLAAATQQLGEDTILLTLRESLPPSVAPSPRLARLTPRQREIALLFARTGLSYKEIAGRLGLSEGTVRKHAENIHRALGVHSRADLAQALAQG
jgi:DNA-binding CsgD family transcriptional regulator